MGELTVLTTFTSGLAVALVLGYVAQRLKIAPLVGYVVAGILVGPFTPGFVADPHVAEQFSEIGVILLLFGIGLRFELRELFAAWQVAIPGAVLQSAASTLALAGALRLLGWPWTHGIVIGMSISVASTVVMAKVLGARGDMATPIGHTAIAWTVVEDLFTVAALLILPMLVGQESQSLVKVFGKAGLQILGLVIAVVVLGKWGIPFAFERVARVRSRELFTLAVLVIALGIAVSASALFGVSMALGAFLAGLAVGRSEFAARAAGEALPMRDAFAVLFFVAVGMLCDPRALVQSPGLIALVLGVVMFVKPVAAFVVVRVLRRPAALAAGIGAALAQVGEFTFILGAAGRGLGVIDDAAWNALVAASILSISLNPTYYGLVRRLSGGAPTLRAPRERPPIDPRRCILIGYGPVGRRVHRLLRDLSVDVTVIELNLETVRNLRTEGTDAVYGDALKRATLESAGLPTAAALVISTEIEDAAELIRQVRTMNPAIQVFARCSHVADVPVLEEAGAVAVAAEQEVAIALADAVRDSFAGARVRGLLPFPQITAPQPG